MSAYKQTGKSSGSFVKSSISTRRERTTRYRVYFPFFLIILKAAEKRMMHNMAPMKYLNITNH